MPCDYGMGPGFEPKHIDRKSLYVSLEERIKYLHDFIDFNSADIEALQGGAKYLKQLIPAVVNLVYKKLLQYDITSRAFYTLTTADETKQEQEQEWLDEEAPKIQRRKMFLRWYLNKLCQDPTSMDFWRYLSKVGIMHAGQERAHPLNIEFVHMNICIAYMQDIFTEALLSHPHISLRRKIALVRAVNKILWIQNDLMGKWRVRDGEEYADEMSVYSFGSGKEGWINDKRILGGDSGSSTDDDDAASIVSSIAPSTHTTNTIQTTQTNTSNISVCPFADLAKGSSTETRIWAN